VPGLLWVTAPDGEPTQINQRALDYVGMRYAGPTASIVGIIPVVSLCVIGRDALSSGGLSVDVDNAKRAGEQPGSAAQLQANLNVLLLDEFGHRSCRSEAVLSAWILSFMRRSSSAKTVRAA
jgi:hypothetical protein